MALSFQITPEAFNYLRNINNKNAAIFLEPKLSENLVTDSIKSERPPVLPDSSLDFEKGTQNLFSKIDDVNSLLTELTASTLQEKAEFLTIRDRLEECYRENVNRPLECRTIAIDFQNCVNRLAQKYLKR